MNPKNLAIASLLACSDLIPSAMAGNNFLRPTGGIQSDATPPSSHYSRDGFEDIPSVDSQDDTFVLTGASAKVSSFDGDDCFGCGGDHVGAHDYDSYLRARRKAMQAAGAANGNQVEEAINS